MNADEQQIIEREEPFFIHQGGSYRRTFECVSTDTGLTIPLNEEWTARMQFRSSPRSVDVLYEATTENSHITIDGPRGWVTLDIPPASSEAWTFTKAGYDFELVSPTGQVHKIAWGDVNVKPEYTKTIN